MALFDLNRSNDTPISTLKLASIVPKDFPTNPLPVPSTSPIYVPTITWYGGANGNDDVFEKTATATDNYMPKTQADKVFASGNPPATPFAIDVTKDRGWIGPLDPYAAPPAAPTITSLSPNTAVHGASDFTLTVNGTGFTPYSAIIWNNSSAELTTYVSPTQLTTLVKGTLVGAPIVIPVQVYDHGALSSVSNFTFT